MNDAQKKLLLLEDDAGDAKLFEMMLLQVAPGEFAVKRAERLCEAKRLLATESFDLILSDLSVPDSRGLNTFTQLMVQAPDVPIVVFSNLDDEAAATKAVQRGAEDFLMKGQVNGTMVVRSLRYAIERRKGRSAVEAATHREHGRLLTFLGAHGGVGTTTVALNVAHALAVQGKRTILVELQPGFGPLSLMLHATPQETLHNVMSLGPDDINEVELGTRMVCVEPNLRVLFGPQRPADFQELNADLVDLILDTLVRMAAFVIVDLPSHVAPASQSAVRSSQFTVVVAERDLISLSCCRMQLELIRPWGAAGSRVAAVVVNRGAVTTPLKMAEIRALLGCDIVGFVPPAADECAAAHSAGVAVLRSHPSSLAAQALAQTADRLAGEHVAIMRLE